MLGLDLMSLAAKHIIDEVFLVAGDSDFVPAVNAVKKEGIIVYLVHGDKPHDDLLDEVDVKPEANTVILYAYDNYSSSLPLDFILNNEIIMAHRMNNVTLPAERGFPFQLVAEQKWGYKWVKWITRIELSDDPEYRGFWESRGYSNDADVEGPYFD